jgi:NAD(P)H-flavin reductase
MSAVADLAAVDQALAPEPYRVRHRRRDTADVVTLTLVPENGPVPAWAPGQFGMLYAFGIGEIPLSISGDPRRRDCLVFTVRAVGAVSRALALASRGAVVGVRAPFGTGWTLDVLDSHHVIVVAGGLGVAPLYPVLCGLLSHRSRPPMTVVVGARSPSELLFAESLTRLGERVGVTVEVTVDHAPAGWTGHVGLVTERLAAARFDPAAVTALLCGPEIMMRLAADQLVRRGVPAEAIQLSLERNMQCGQGWCGHCQLGPVLLCRDGPVLTWERAEPLLRVKEL